MLVLELSLADKDPLGQHGGDRRSRIQLTSGLMVMISHQSPRRITEFVPAIIGSLR